MGQKRGCFGCGHDVEKDLTLDEYSRLVCPYCIHTVVSEPRAVGVFFNVLEKRLKAHIDKGIILRGFDGSK